MLALVGAGIVAAGTAGAETFFGFQTGTAKAPPPPIVTLPRSPRFEIVPRTRVYVTYEEPPGVDLFRYEGYWYAYSGSHWYRSRSARQAFQVVEVHVVPRTVLFVPMKYWQRHPDRNSRMALGTTS